MSDDTRPDHRSPPSITAAGVAKLIVHHCLASLAGVIPFAPAGPLALFAPIIIPAAVLDSWGLGFGPSDQALWWLGVCGFAALLIATLVVNLVWRRSVVRRLWLLGVAIGYLVAGVFVIRSAMNAV